MPWGAAYRGARSGLQLVLELLLLLGQDLVGRDELVERWCRVTLAGEVHLLDQRFIAARSAGVDCSRISDHW